MQWSKLKKRVESFLATSLVGRLELRSTSYRRSHDQEGRGYLTLDGEEIWNMATIPWERQQREKVAEIAERTGLRPIEAQTLAHDELAAEGFYGQHSFYASLKAFCEGSAEANLESSDVLLRALAVCDRRVGKRRLARMNMDDEHPVVKRLYLVRIAAEGLENPKDGDL